ncbi:InlB B-repeat-containing protein [Bacteroides sp. UBA939]|uniref:RCC1 domain-containing protein n=1 Tax=Bacteroides sp. UBA939 TaxID=1946092 RepID=UPI0025BD9029|nr:InlB B-repeat-containing protein [Bacteroides sp. UBA939]
MKKIWLIALASILLGMVSCGEDDPAEETFYTVSFDAGGGTPAPKVQRVKEGDKATAPATNPAKDGYVFLYWHTSGATTAYNFQTPVTGDFTLYAKWTAEGGEEKPGNAMVASGRYSYFVLNANGVLQASGRNDYGQFGMGDKTDMQTLTQIATDVAAVYAGGSSAFILKKDGSLLGVGANVDGNLGLGDEENRTTFTAIPVTDVKTIAAGSAHTLLLKNNGSVWASGWNSYGRLGIGSETHQNKFTATTLTSGITAIAAGYEFSLALKEDGTVWGAGYGYAGCMGENGLQATIPSFIEIYSGVKAIAAGTEHSLLLKEDGTVYASGGNGYGQLGVGLADHQERYLPAVTTSNVPLTDVIAIAAAPYHSLALKADGTLWAAGSNVNGLLGTGDFVNKREFVQIASSVVSMSAGRTHSVVLKKDGTTQVYGHVNPWDRLNGNSRFLISVDDTNAYRSISSWVLSCGGAEIAKSTSSISTGAPATQISVKPGTYTMTFRTSNSSTPHNIVDIVVGNDENVIIRYEYVSSRYQWTVIHAPK